MPVDELVTKDLDEIVGEQIEDPSREENLEKIQKQLNLVLQLENKVQKEANRKVFDDSLDSEPRHLSDAWFGALASFGCPVIPLCDVIFENFDSEKAEEKPKKPATPRLAMNFANAKK